MLAHIDGSEMPFLRLPRTSAPAKEPRHSCYSAPFNGQDYSIIQAFEGSANRTEFHTLSDYSIIRDSPPAIST